METTIDLGGDLWQIADPSDTQDEDHSAVPRVPGHYLWLRRNPGERLHVGAGNLWKGPAEQMVLYVGRTKDLRDRLHRYSSIHYKREDPVLHALFDRVVAPKLSDKDLRLIVCGRLAPTLAQMWIRDHVVFGWMPWEGPGLHGRESALRVALRPVFNSDGRWTRYEQTWHELHDLTLPIEPYDPFSPYDS